MSSDATTLINRYCAVWNEPEPERRRAMLEAVWDEQGVYTDPRANATGIEALLAHIAAVRAGRPGARIVRTTAVDMHHGVARFGWCVVEADGTLLPEGIDIVWFTPDGARIAQILGFFGPMAPL